MKREPKRCRHCILPQNYPGVSFDEDGICKLCRTYKPPNYLGTQALQTTIRSFLENRDDVNREYDCILGVSGGRDSVYLLHYLVKVVRLRVLAYCADNGYMPVETKRNLERATEILGVDLLVESHDYLRKCLSHVVLSWTKRPSAALLTTLCTGCRLGIFKGLSSVARSKQIPIVIAGGSPFEEAAYKINLMRINPYWQGKRWFLIGYLRQVVKNPRLIMKPSFLATQLREFHYYSNRRLSQKRGLFIAPFYSHLHWKEDNITSTITRELNWQGSSIISSTWKNDCRIALLKSHMYRSILGFDDNDDHLSWLVRDGQIDREEALDRLRKVERETPKEVIPNIVEKLGIHQSDFRSALDRAVWV